MWAYPRVFPHNFHGSKKYISARADYDSFDTFLEFQGGSKIGTTIQGSNTRSLVRQQNQQNLNKQARILRSESILKAICCNSFSENVSN